MDGDAGMGHHWLMARGPEHFRTHVVPDVLAWVVERGGDGTKLLALAGMPTNAGEVAHVDVPLDTLHRFLALAAKEADDPALGLHVGARLSLGTWDLLQLSCKSAPTLGAALSRIPRLMPLFNDAVEVEVDPGPPWRISHRVVARPEGLSRHGNELLVATMLARSSEAVGVPIVPRACWFGHPRPADVAPLVEAFGGADLTFGAGSTGLELAADDLARPLAGADPVLSSVLDRLSDAALERQGGRRGLAARVYRAIRANLADGPPPVDRLARELGMSARSLQRTLTEEGVSFTALIDQVRRDQARVLLAAGLPRGDIADQLGYSETASFTRALARWSRHRQ